MQKKIDECRHTTTLSVILFGDLVPITLLLKYTVKEEKITSDTIMVCENIILPLSILPKHTTIIGRCTIYFGDCVPAIYRPEWMLNEITAFSSKITICSTSNDNSKKISSILFNYFFDEKMTKSAEKKTWNIYRCTQSPQKYYYYFYNERNWWDWEETSTNAHP